MTSNGRFQPGQSGNPASQFKPGNRHRWQPGQSGNPAGTPRSRLQLEERVSKALLGDGSADEVANVLWEALLKRESWAIQAVLRCLRSKAKQNDTDVRRDHAAVKIANHPVVLSPGAADDGGDSRPADRLATPAVNRPTRATVAEEDSSNRVSVKQRYEEFCLAKVKDHLRALPQAVRSQRFDETRSAIRRAVPQLRRNEVDEVAQRELESKIRLALSLPSIEEFTARTF